MATALAGSLEDSDRLGITEELSAHSVLGGFRRLGAVSEEVPECLGMPSLADRRSHVFVQGLLKERVRELRPTRLGRPDQTGVDENSQGFGRFALIEPSHPRREQRPELDAEHAGGVGVAEVGARARDAGQHDGGLRSAFVELSQAATISQMARDLLKEEGVAAARGPGPVDGLLGWLATHLLRKQR